MKKVNKLSILSLLTLLSLTSCGNSLNSYSKKINKSINNAVEVVETLIIEDGDVEVYKMIKTITLHREDKVVSGIVSIVEYNLSSNFTYVESTSNDTFEGENKVIFNLNLNKDYFVDYSLEKGVLNGEVKKENAKDFFNVETLDCSSNPNVEMVLEKNLLTSYNCSYLTLSDKEVSINVTYSY